MVAQQVALRESDASCIQRLENLIWIVVRLCNDVDDRKALEDHPADENWIEPLRVAIRSATGYVSSEEAIGGRHFAIALDSSFPVDTGEESLAIELGRKEFVALRIGGKLIS